MVKKKKTSDAAAQARIIEQAIKQYEQARAKTAQQDPYGNAARKPTPGTFGGTDPWVQTLPQWGPQTLESANQIRPELQNMMMRLMQQGYQQSQPGLMDPFEYQNMMGDPEMGMGGMLQPLLNSLLQKEVVPRIPNLMEWLSNYLSGTQQQQQQQQNQPQQPPVNLTPVTPTASVNPNAVNMEQLQKALNNPTAAPSNPSYGSGYGDSYYGNDTSGFGAMDRM